jgi:hypothetical protein
MDSQLTWALYAQGYCRLIAEEAEAELARFTIRPNQTRPSLIFARIFRMHGPGSNWAVEAIGRPADGITTENVQECCQRHLKGQPPVWSHGGCCCLLHFGCAWPILCRALDALVMVLRLPCRLCGT